MKTSTMERLGKELLLNTIKKSTTVKEVLTYYNLEVSGGSHQTLYNICKKFKLLTELNKLKKRSYTRIRPENNSLHDLKTVFCKDSKVSRSVLRKRIKRDLVFKQECSTCGLGSMWKNKELTLQVDHKNGDNRDNRIRNLRYLCPNCHSQTKTFAGRNRKVRAKQKTCIDCNRNVAKYSTRCNVCAGKKSRKDKGE